VWVIVLYLLLGGGVGWGWLVGGIGTKAIPSI
jgi:hypothetical protein